MCCATGRLFLQPRLFCFFIKSVRWWECYVIGMIIVRCAWISSSILPTAWTRIRTPLHSPKLFPCFGASTAGRNVRLRCSFPAEYLRTKRKTKTRTLISPYQLYPSPSGADNMHGISEKASRVQRGVLYIHPSKLYTCIAACFTSLF